MIIWPQAPLTRKLQDLCLIGFQIERVRDHMYGNHPRGCLASCSKELPTCQSNATQGDHVTPTSALVFPQDGLNASKSSAADGASDGDVFSDPVHGLHASTPKDFVIFINLVDFCRYQHLCQLWMSCVGIKLHWRPLSHKTHRANKGTCCCESHNMQPASNVYKMGPT